MKNRLSILLVLLAFAAVSFLNTTGKGMTQPSETRQAFSATILETRFDSNHTERYREYQIVAVRSDGSRAHIYRRQTPDGRWVESRTILDLAAGKWYSIDPMTESVVTYPLSSTTTNSQAQADKTCAGLTTSESDQMYGYDVVRKLESRTKQDGTIASRTDQWLAPELDCFPLRITRSAGAGGTPSPYTTREVLFITPGEPAPALFAIPSGYTERSPSQVLAEFHRQYPERGTAHLFTAQALDNAYFSHQRYRR